MDMESLPSAWLQTSTCAAATGDQLATMPPSFWPSCVRVQAQFRKCSFASWLQLVTYVPEIQDYTNNLPRPTLVQAKYKALANFFWGVYNCISLLRCCAAFPCRLWAHFTESSCHLGTQRSTTGNTWAMVRPMALCRLVAALMACTEALASQVPPGPGGSTEALESQVLPCCPSPGAWGSWGGQGLGQTGSYTVSSAPGASTSGTCWGVPSSSTHQGALGREA